MLSLVAASVDLRLRFASRPQVVRPSFSRSATGPAVELTSTHDHGFTFDAGPTVITAPDCLRELFSLAGKSMDDYVKLLRSIRFIGYFGRMVTSSTTPLMLGPLEDQIRQKSPGILRAISSFLTYSEKVFHEGYEKLAHVPFSQSLEHGFGCAPVDSARRPFVRSTAWSRSISVTRISTAI